jgi:hypothetical protein
MTPQPAQGSGSEGERLLSLGSRHSRIEAIERLLQHIGHSIQSIACSINTVVLTLEVQHHDGLQRMGDRVASRQNPRLLHEGMAKAITESVVLVGKVEGTARKPVADFLQVYPDFAVAGGIDKVSLEEPKVLLLVSDVRIARVLLHQKESCLQDTGRKGLGKK